MPLAIDPAWEYWMPDPEIEAAMLPSKPYTLRELYDGDFGYSNKTGSDYKSGFRFGCTARQLNWMPTRLAPARYIQREILPKKCKRCGYTFYPARSARVFCSRRCKHAAQALPLQACQRCRKQFKPHWQGQLCCSVLCANSIRHLGHRKTDYDNIAALYIQGLKLSDIAHQCGISKPSVKRIVKQLDLPRRPSGNFSRSKNERTPKSF